MKKILPFLALVILVLSGLEAGANFENNKTLLKEDIINISEPKVTEENNYLTVELKESTSTLLKTGYPMLPIISKTYTFLAGTKIVGIDINLDFKEFELSKKIKPTPESHPIGKDIVYVKTDDNLIGENYKNLYLYPEETYTVTKTIGLKDKEHVLSVSIRINSQYIPSEDILKVPTNIDIKIEYKPPKNPLFTADEYDLLIITDEKFVDKLQPLVTHKESMGVRTIIDTTQNIYSNYDGRDNPEDIKLRIKDAIEEWGISYVFLAGGRKGQSLKWYVLERRTNNDDGYEGGYSSDLYYGDIYKDDEGTPVFDDWDSNGNGIFAEWSGPNGRDIMDYDPDVSVGRIPFRYSFEVDIIVDKIITYETSTDDSWFKQALVISGDTGPPCRGPATPGIYEGELATGISADLLESIGFTVDRLWLSLGAWNGRRDIVNAISQGCGFIHMAGHGNPAYWGNFLPDAQSEDEMVDGLILRDMKKLRNGDKLPVVVVGGCHNAQFNVTMGNILHGILTYGFREYFDMNASDDGPDEDGDFGRFWMKEWVPREFCSWLVMEKGGGAIASTGCSGLGLGYFDVLGLADWIEPRFFDVYANQSIDILGEVHDQAIRDYIHIQGGVNSNQDDRKTIEEWTLIGDPSLMIGGYN